MDDGWVLKGATALLARDIGVRGTIDVDLYRQAAQQDAQADLRRAVAVDLSNDLTLGLVGISRRDERTRW
jgi:hypothetical protein